VPGRDTHGDSDFKSIGNANTYGDPYGSGLSYAYINGDIHTHGNAFTHANLRTSRHTRSVEHGQPLSVHSVWRRSG
jgi:hypothetical protein